MEVNTHDWYTITTASLGSAATLKYLTIAGVIYLIVKYLVIPLDWTKEMDESGYSNVPGTGYRRLNQIDKVRRNRKIGDIPPVYPNGWFMLAESHQIKKNTPLQVTALGENFALFRGADGQCHILHAYCPHLGANMAIGGRIVGDCIECPFHKWQFNGYDGKCTHIPYSDKVPKFAEVKRYRSLEVNDMIFVWYHAEDEEPTWVPDEIPEIASGKYFYRGRNEFKINAHIQEIPENGSDVWHFNALHSTSVIFGSDIAANNSDKKFFNHEWESTWEPSTDPAMRHIGVSKLLHHVKVFGFILGKLDIDIRQMGPGYVELKFWTPLGRMVITQTVTPIEPMIQKVVHRVYAPWTMALYATLMIIGESIMVERDIMVWNNKKYLERPLLVKEDKALAKYRRWFSQFYSEHSPTYSTDEKIAGMVVFDYSA
uniref:cholesterol 7-desaturase n=1 Tax=Lygus hesperus TaxID=30085 RepID=A0A0K8SMI1_LYGHE